MRHFTQVGLQTWLNPICWMGYKQVDVLMVLIPLASQFKITLSKLRVKPWGKSINIVVSSHVQHFSQNTKMIISW